MWNKIKKWFKKYWGYIATFVGGIVTYLLIDSRGNLQELGYRL